jgi:hypothetical protein
MRPLFFLLVVLVACGSHVESPALAPSTPSATPTQAATVTPSPTPTLRANPTAGPGTYTNALLAYRIDIPAGWRRSTCQSSRDPAEPKSDVFTNATVDAETGGGLVSGQDSVSIYTDDTLGQTAMALATSRFGSSVGQHFDQVTFDGKDAVRVTSPNGIWDLAYVIPARGHLYVVARVLRTNVADRDSRAMMGSFHVLTDADLAAARATIAAPTSAPARSMQQVADVVTRGFMAKDSTVLGTVVAPCVMRGAEPGDADWASTSIRLAELQQMFAAGLVVTFQGGPQITGGPAVIRTTWTVPGEQARTVKLWLQSFGSTWYWEGWITCAFASC